MDSRNASVLIASTFYLILCCSANNFSSCYRGKCYQRINMMTWEDSVTRCLEMDAALVSIHSAEENQYVSNVCGGNCWIGLHDTVEEGKFVWEDGTPVDYTNWKEGEPNALFVEEDSARIKENGEWNDARGSKLNPAVCMKPAPPTDLPTTAPFTDLPTTASTDLPTTALLTDLPTTASTDLPTTAPTDLPSTSPIQPSIIAPIQPSIIAPIQPSIIGSSDGGGEGGLYEKEWWYALTVLASIVAICYCIFLVYWLRITVVKQQNEEEVAKHNRERTPLWLGDGNGKSKDGRDCERNFEPANSLTSK